MQSLAALILPSSDERRKRQNKYLPHMPADMAAATVILTSTHPTRPDPKPTEHPCGLPALRRERVLVPLIEPNVLTFGRMNTRRHAPYPETASDGVMTVLWDTPAVHTTALADTVQTYLDTHSLVADIADRAEHSGLDSWHSPLALVPVRHTYADGSPSQARWMTADGSARIVGARIGLSRTFGWLTDHPYADPHSPWPSDIVTLRKFLAAARAEAQRLAIQANDRNKAEGGYDPDSPAKPEYYLPCPALEDWADLLLPTPPVSNTRDNGSVYHNDVFLSTVNIWNFRSHNNPAAKADETRHNDDVVDYIEGVDVFSGRDPFDLLSADPARAHERQNVADNEQEVREFLLDLGNSSSRQVQRAVLMSVAVSDPRTAPDIDLPLDLLDDYFYITLGADNSPSGYTASTLRYIFEAVQGTLGAPNLSDLYGIYADLTGGTVSEPLRNPDSPWFWLGVTQGVYYAAVLRHLDWRHDAFKRIVRWMLTTPAGTAQALAYADACQDSLVRVPLISQPDQYADRVSLAATSATTK